MKEFTLPSGISLADVTLTPEMQASLILLPPHVRQLVIDTVTLAQCSKALAESYQQLHLEVALLSAERDSLAAHLMGMPAPPLH